MKIFGIDIGGSGIKGAPVNTKTGALLSERYRVPTPQPSTPEAVGEAVAQVVRHFGWQGPIGCTFPAVIKKGVACSAANVDKAWLGFNGQKLLEKKVGRPVVLINDADAAGLAEMKFGAGRGEKGVVFVITFGTGIGTAIFVNRRLLPNTELGHIEMNGREVEPYISDRTRQEEMLDWPTWAGRVNEYLALLEAIFSPDLFILGGSVSKKSDKYLHLLSTRARIAPAQLLNNAGIVGAALAARKVAR